MAVATLTSKGQVTIPKKIRDQLRLRTGDKLDFRLDADGSVSVHPIARKVSDVFGVFQDKAVKRLKDAQIQRRLRQAFRDGKL